MGTGGLSIGTPTSGTGLDVSATASTGTLTALANPGDMLTGYNQNTNGYSGIRVAIPRKQAR
jgi:hypothetical protein